MGCNANSIFVDWNFHAIVNLFGNMALFLPIGFFSMWISSSNKSKKAVIGITAKCLLISVVIEILQLCSMRIVDVTDVVLNTLGGFLGCLLFLYLLTLTNNFGGRYKRITCKEKNRRTAALRIVNILICITTVIFITNVL